MNNQIRPLSPTMQLNNERAIASSIHVGTELGDEELSKVSGGRLNMVCVQGRHIKRGKLIC